MENFEKNYNKESSEDLLLPLDQDKLERAMWGVPIEIAADELIKILTIVNHVQNKRDLQVEEIKAAAKDLFEQFKVEIFDFDDIFTGRIINQIYESRPLVGMSFKFNNIPLLIRNGDSVKSVVSQWEDATAEDPDKKEKRETKEKEFISERQNKLDNMVSQIDKLDFSNIERVVDWLYEYNEHIAYGVNMHQDYLIEKFKDHGYSVKRNDRIEFMLGETLKDKQRFGEALVGFMLQNLGLFEQHDETKKVIEDWKRSYF